MREVIILNHCDLCFQRNQTKADATVSTNVAIGTLALDELDLCENCDMALLEPLRKVIQVRRATEQAAKQAAERSHQPPPPGGGRRDHKVYCGSCRVWIGIRSRNKHAEDYHNTTDPADIAWAFGPEVEKVWKCGCGLAFPTETGTVAHSRRLNHDLPDELAPSTPLRVADLDRASPQGALSA